MRNPMLSLVAAAFAGAAINQVTAAPMDIIVVSTQKFPNGAEMPHPGLASMIDRLEAFAKANGKAIPMSPGVVTGGGPHFTGVENIKIELDENHHDEEGTENPYDLFSSPRIKLHPAFESTGDELVPVSGEPKHVGCGGKAHAHGRVSQAKWAVAKKMRTWMNSLRKFFGLPEIHGHYRLHHHHHHNKDGESETTEDGKTHAHPHHHHHHHQEQKNEAKVTGFGQYANTGESFLVRFTRAVNTLSPFESGAVSFVFGLGLGALIRMFVVFAILIVRARRGQSFCERRRARRAARRAAAEASILAQQLPPAYSAAPVDEKAAVRNVAQAQQTLKDVCAMIITIGEEQDGERLQVVWKHVDGSEVVSPASHFHAQYPEKLLEFYEGNLKWRPVEDDEVTVA